MLGALSLRLKVPLKWCACFRTEVHDRQTTVVLLTWHQRLNDVLQPSESTLLHVSSTHVLVSYLFPETNGIFSSYVSCRTLILCTHSHLWPLFFVFLFLFCHQVGPQTLRTTFHILWELSSPFPGDLCSILTVKLEPSLLRNLRLCASLGGWDGRTPKRDFLIK